MRFTCCDQLPVQRSHWPKNDIIVNITGLGNGYGCVIRHA